MKTPRILLALATLMIMVPAWSQNAERGPRIGYCYPAGGQQSTSFEVLLGGQFLQKPSAVLISGEGVRGEVIQFAKPFNNMQLQELRQLLAPALTKASPEKQDMPVIGLVEAGLLPEHPFTRQICKMTVRELNHWVTHFLGPNRRQMNAQIAEMVVLQITVDATAQPGDRELRLLTAAGLTNPLGFQVGTLRENIEHEPNDIVPTTPEPLTLPVVLNGQIMPGDVDRLHFQARRGQKVVAAVQARRLMPYLADAVPGWFQPVVTLRDNDGAELAFADDFKGDPDPVLAYDAQADGDYMLEIHDSIYRGRDDFVYRIYLGELPVITSISPLGAQTGRKSTVAVSGWNLPLSRLPLDSTAGVHMLTADAQRDPILPVPYIVEDAAQCGEKEPNDTIETAYVVAPPRIVNGVIGKAGDCDVFRFKGRAGNEIVADVMARRLQSPVDALLRLTDSSGKVLEWKDDCEDKSMGLMTHHADAFLRYTLPADGDYFIQMSDAQNKGGEEYGYRLRISPPQPDFALRVTPSAINVGAGRAALVTVHAIRRDGFDGEIKLALKDVSSGFILQGGILPAGRDSIRMTLTAPRNAPDQPVALDIEGVAKTAAGLITRAAVPAEDMMQAFIYQHLVPANHMLASVTPNKRQIPPVAITELFPVQIPSGGTAAIHVRVPRKQVPKDVKFALETPPKGITLQKSDVDANGYVLTVAAEADAPKPGYADNLIVEAYVEIQPKADAKPAKQKQRATYGVLPAIPVVIVK